MKIFRDFTEADTYFCGLFSQESNPFAQLKYRGVAICIALQHNLYDYYKSFVYAGGAKLSLLQKALSLLRIKGLDHKAKFTLNKYISRRPPVVCLNNKVVFFADNYVPRILHDFLKVIPKMANSDVAFCTTDYRTYRFMQKHVNKTECAVVLIGSRPGFKRHTTNRKRLKLEFKQNLKPWLHSEFGRLGNKMEKIVSSNLNLLADYFDVFEDFLQEAKPKSIVLGSDGFSIARILCFASAKRGINTFVIQHGLIDSLNGYLPLIADSIFVWSENKKKIFEERGVAANRMLVAGSPRFDFDDNLKTPGGIAKSNQLLFVISPGVPQDVYDQIDTILKIENNLKITYNILIRPHPYYRKMAETYFKNLMPVANISLDDKPFLQSVRESEIVVFSNISTGVFEVAALGKSAYILADERQSKLDIYQLPKIPIAELIEGLNNSVKGMQQYNLLSMQGNKSNSFIHIASSSTIAAHLTDANINSFVS